MTPGLLSWPTPLQAFALVASLRLRLQQQGYGARSCLKIMLNILKDMRGSISIYIPSGM